MESLAQAPITLALLVLNVGVSLYALFSDPAVIDRLALRPQRIRDKGEYFRFITAGFVHADLGHLAFNMITLFFFGPLLELYLGGSFYLLLYFGSMLAAHVFSFAFNRDDPYYSAVGASGAISGVVFAFCVYQPLSLLYLFFAIPIPAILFAVGYVVGSAYAMKQGRENGQRGGIAHEAHIGGAVAGVFITILLDPRALPSFMQAFQGLLGG